MKSFDTKQFAQMARAVLRGGKRYGDHNMMHPVRDWYLGLSVFIVVCVIGGSWAAAVFMKYQDVSVYDAAVTTGSNTSYRGQLVATALLEIERRQERFEDIYSRLQNVPMVSVPVASEATTTDERGEGVPSEDATTSDAVREENLGNEEATSSTFSVTEEGASEVDQE